METSEDTFLKIIGAGREIRRSSNYFWDNRKRSIESLFVIQRTLSGSCSFEHIESKFAVPQDHAMLFTHNESSSYGVTESSLVPYDLEYVLFQGLSAQNLFSAIRSDFGSVIQMKAEGEAAAKYADLLSRFRDHRMHDHLHETELITSLLISIYREQLEQTGSSNPIELGYQTIQNHFSRPINVKEIALQANLSREHFTRLFIQRYQVSPGRLLRKLRLKQAQTMLHLTPLPINEIALSCGFTSSNAFCRAYRNQFGQSPGIDRTRMT